MGEVVDDSCDLTLVMLLFHISEKKIRIRNDVIR